MYIKYNDANFRIPRGTAPDGITPEQAIAIVSGEVKKQAAIRTFASGAELLDGRYGPYIKYNGKNYKIPKEYIPSELSEEQVNTLIATPPATKKRSTAKK